MRDKKVRDKKKKIITLGDLRPLKDAKGGVPPGPCNPGGHNPIGHNAPPDPGRRPPP